MNKIIRGTILYWSERLGCNNALVSSTTHVCHLRQGETVESLKKKKKKGPRFFEWILEVTQWRVSFCFHSNSFGGDDQGGTGIPATSRRPTEHSIEPRWFCTVTLADDAVTFTQILTASLAYEPSWTSLPSILHDEVGIWYSWSNKDPALIIQVKKENSVSPWALETFNI